MYSSVFGQGGLCVNVNTLPHNPDGNIHYPVVCLHQLPFPFLSFFLSILRSSNMSEPPQTRSKRPRSTSEPEVNPAAGSSSLVFPRPDEEPPRVTSLDPSRLCPASCLRLDAISNLTMQQKDDLLRRMCQSDLMGASVSALLPSIVPTQPELVQNTKSVYFDNRVDWYEAMLGDRAWTRHSSTSIIDICKMIGTAVSSELDQVISLIGRSVDGSPNITPAKCSMGEYYVDAAIALLDIGLLVFERQARFKKADNHPIRCACLCLPCVDCDKDTDANDKTCQVYDCFESLRLAINAVQPNMETRLGRKDGDSQDSELEMDENIKEEWLNATFYAGPDGTPHDLRVAILNYVDLPALKPFSGLGEEIGIEVEISLRRCILGINRIVKSGKMPYPSGRPLLRIPTTAVIVDVDDE